MKLGSIQKRRMRLTHEIGKAVSFEVCVPHVRGYHSLHILWSSSGWVRKTYSADPVPDEYHPSLLMSDLLELGRRGWIYFDPYSAPPDNYGGKTYCPDPKKWTIGLQDEGLAAVEEQLKPWWTRAYEKQPVTAWQILVTVIISVVTFLGGYILGKRDQSGSPPAIQPQTSAPAAQTAPHSAKNEGHVSEGEKTGQVR